MKRAKMWFFLLGAAAAGCAADPALDPTGGDDKGDGATSARAASIHFEADGDVSTSGKLVTGKQARVRYDSARLDGCRGDFMGQPAWRVTLMVKDRQGTFRAFPADEDNVIEVPAGELEAYAYVSNRWGCIQYDSKNGANYHFPAAAGAAPAQIDFRVGDVSVRGTPAAGSEVVVSYDADRLTTCRAMGWQMWIVWRFDGSDTQSTSTQYGPVTIPTPAGARDLELWFENADRYGCRAYDSDYGKNFHFALKQ